MNVTPEVVKVEMEYRLERALHGTELEHVRAVRGLHPSWWRRVLRHRSQQPDEPENGAGLAA